MSGNRSVNGWGCCCGDLGSSPETGPARGGARQPRVHLPLQESSEGGRGTCNQSPPLQQQHGFRDLQMKIRNYVLGWRCCQIHRSDLVEIRVPFTKEILTCCSQQANSCKTNLYSNLNSMVSLFNLIYTKYSK